MPRQPRVVAVGVPHHITQRGNFRQTVFSTDADRLFYLETLRRKCRDHGLAVLGWCLMPNHVHLIATPSRSDSLARGIGETHHKHALRFNAQRRRNGHLWQARFYSSPLGPGHLIDALAYLDLNPVRARLTAAAAAYPWSSTRAHLSHHDPSGLLDLVAWSAVDRDRDWGDVLASRSLSRTARRAFQAATHHGRPWGDEPFIAELEIRLRRPLRPQPRGRRPAAATASVAAAP